MKKHFKLWYLISPVFSCGMVCVSYSMYRTVLVYNRTALVKLSAGVPLLFIGFFAILFLLITCSTVVLAIRIKQYNKLIGK